MSLDEFGERLTALEQEVSELKKRLPADPRSNARSTAPRPPGGTDPFDKWLGAISSDVPNWANEHDRHIGESALREYQDPSR
jgi:hypothetical protein